MKDYHFDYIVKNEDGQIVEQDNILHRGSSEEDAKQKALSFLEDVYKEKYYDEFTPTIEMAKDSYAGGGEVDDYTWLNAEDYVGRGHSYNDLDIDERAEYIKHLVEVYKSNDMKYYYLSQDGKDRQAIDLLDENTELKKEIENLISDYNKDFGTNMAIKSFYSSSYAGGGGVRVLKSEGRYRIYGEIHGNKPFLIEATDDRSSLKELTKGAKEWIRGAVGDSRVFVVDTKEDREIFENQYAKGGGIKKRMYGGRACQCRCCPTCNNGWGINTQW
jgi:hypothetical protein